MSIQNSAAALESDVLNFIPAPRTGSPVVARAPRHVELAPETETALTPVETVVDAPIQPKPFPIPWAALGTLLLACGCTLAASFVVAAGPALPAVAVIGILFSLFLIGQAVGRTPRSDEHFDIR